MNPIGSLLGCSSGFRIDVAHLNMYGHSGFVRYFSIRTVRVSYTASEACTVFKSYSPSGICPGTYDGPTRGSVLIHLTVPLMGSAAGFYSSMFVLARYELRSAWMHCGDSLTVIRVIQTNSNSVSWSVLLHPTLE
jgi:hypothetical protein